MSMCFAFFDVPCRVAMLLPALESVCGCLPLMLSLILVGTFSSVDRRLFLCKLRRAHFLQSSMLL